MTAVAAKGWGVLSVPGEAAIDRAEVLRACALLFDPEHSVELRGLPSGRSFVRPGGASDELAACAERLASDRGVYFCLNPVSVPAGADRAARVADVVKRRWLLIDVDPVRPADTNATKAEKAAAQAVTSHVTDWLAARGWPVPVVVDSGNGWHLLYRVEMDADDASQKLIKALLKALGSRFDTAEAKVDPSVHNASRVSKLPGTWARKGPHSAERPHRKASVWHAPDPVEVVPVEKIREAIDELSQAGKDTVVEDTKPGWGTLNAGGAGPGAYERAGEYIDACGEAVSGERGHPKTMSVARGVVWGFGLGVEAGLRLLKERYNSRCRPPWSDKELLHKCEDAWNTPDPSGRPCGYLLDEWKRGAANPSGKSKQQQAGGVKRPSIIRLSDLMEMELPPPVWVVPGLLSEGLTILAGKPKLGKSWLALNIALTVAAGGKVLGQMEARPGAVLYLSLEDRLRRVQDRARKLLAGTGLAVSRRLSLAVEWPRQDAGGLDEIALWAEREENPSLVIVDVWQKFRPPAKGSSGMYDQDYHAMGQLKSVIDEKKLSAIVVHHCKKAKAEDALEEVSGTNGLAGAADGVLVLSRARNENEGSLFVTGRDFEEQKLAVSFDPKTFVWTSLGDAESRVHSQLGRRILDMLRSAGPGAAFWPREITERLKADAATVRTALLRLLDKGLVQRKGAGMYSWPEEGPGDARVL